MKPRVVLTVVLVGILAFGAGMPVRAADRPIHWFRTGPPAILTVFDELHDAAWTQVLHTSVDEWNAGTSNIDMVLGVGAADCVNGQGLNTVVVCFRENSEANHRGETRWHHDGTHLLKSMVWMDIRDHPPNTRASLMCHELGHVLGLEHRPDKDQRKTCMTSTAGWNHPDRHDYRNVTLAHDHTH